jgi:hypothetical protein
VHYKVPVVFSSIREDYWDFAAAPDTGVFFLPFRKPFIAGTPKNIRFRQISPRGSASDNPKNPADGGARASLQGRPIVPLFRSGILSDLYPFFIAGMIIHYFAKI